MPVAGHIVAHLTANTTGWTAGLRDAIGPLQAAAAVITGMAVGAVTRFNTVGSALDDMRQRTGISATELSQLGFAAQMSDTSLESLQSGLTKMNVFLREARSGGAGATSMLTELGLSLDQLNSTDNIGKIGLIADALNNIENPGERAAVAMKIFGKGAVDLLPLLNSGSDGLREFAAESDRLGLTMDDDTAAGAARLGDELDKLTSVVDRLLVSMGGELAPVVTHIASVTTEWLVGHKELLMTLGKSAIVIVAVAGAIKAVTLATQAYTKAQTVALAFSGPKGWAMLAAGVVALGASTWAVSSAMASVNSSLQAADAASSQSAASTARETAARVEATIAANAQHTALQDLRKQYDDLIPRSQQIRNQVQQIGKDWHAAAAAGAQLAMTWDQMKELQTQTTLQESGFSGMFAGLTAELAVLRGEITETEQQLQDMASAGVDDRRIGQLRQMIAERDRLLSDQQQQEREAQDEQARLAGIADRVSQSQDTPLSQFAAEVRDIQDAIDAGAISSAQGLAYLEQRRQAMLTAEQAAETASRTQASNVGLDARSAQANQMIVDLVNRRSSSPEQAALEEARRNTALAQNSNNLLKDIRDDARRRTTVVTRPFGQRT